MNSLVASPSDSRSALLNRALVAAFLENMEAGEKPLKRVGEVARPSFHPVKNLVLVRSDAVRRVRGSEVPTPMHNFSMRLSATPHYAFAQARIETVKCN